MSTKKATKRALLTSILAICMCLVMLVGSTFAWFTDTASTSVNKIQSGTLDVDIMMKQTENNETKWVSAEGETLKFRNVNGSTDILWEPGATFNLDTFKIVNKGNLALKYTVTITGAVGDAELLDAIEFFVKKGEAEPVALAGWDGILLPKGATADATSTDAKKTDVEETTEILIYGKMKESAGNDCMDKTLTGIAITVNATQYTYEYDSKDNQYDKDAEYAEVVNVTPDTIPSPFKANTTYFFGAGNYGDQHFVITDQENVTLIGKAGAAFDSLQISSIDYVNDEIGQVVDLANSTLTVKGFTVTGALTVVESDKNVVVEGNAAAQITVKTNMSNQSITVNNNTLTGGSAAPQGYGVYIVPNVSDYDLTVNGNTFTNIQSHAICVQGVGDGSAVTAAKSITVAGNNFVSYGLNEKDNRAAFKIWADTKFAPAQNGALTADATALVVAIEAGNTFGTLGSKCVLGDFYDTVASFTANP